VPRKCNPACSYFQCSKHAKIIRNINGRKIVYCRWIRDRCIGYRCQYAICLKHALLPNGICALSIRTAHREKSIEEEAKELEMEMARLRNKFKRLGENIDI